MRFRSFSVYFLALFIFTRSISVFGKTTDWMAESFTDRPNTRLVDIAIPGTHNSATYGISATSKVEPGENFGYYLVKPIVASWAKTQYRTLFEQLEMGIRFFDLRIAFDRKSTPIIVHGLVSIPLEMALKEVSYFIEIHPREVVFLTYKLSHGFAQKLDEGEAARLLKLVDENIAQHFGERLLPSQENVTFADFWSGNHSVYVIKDLQDLWPNAFELKVVKEYLDYAAKSKDPNRFSNLQMIYTPPGDVTVFINPRYLRLFSRDENSLSEFSEPLRKHGLSWIQRWHQMGYKPNIISTDFFDKFGFVQTVLEINTDEVLSVMP